MTNPKEIYRIETYGDRRRRMNRSLLHQTVLQCFTFGAAILTYHLVAMPPAVDDAYARGYGQAYRTYCTGTCLNK